MPLLCVMIPLLPITAVVMDPLLPITFIQYLVKMDSFLPITFRSRTLSLQMNGNIPFTWQGVNVLHVMWEGTGELEPVSGRKRLTIVD